MSWLHDEQGKVRRELYTQSPNEIAAKAAELDARPTSYQGHPSFSLQVHVKAKYSIVEGCDGWMNVVRFDRSAINGPHVLAERPDGGGGGFIGLEMIDGLRVGHDLLVPGRVDWRELFLAPALESAPPTWQPMDTAPKDGTAILRPHRIWGAMDVRYKPTATSDGRSLPWINCDLTTAWPEEAFLPFWMPLPAAPAADAAPPEDR